MSAEEKAAVEAGLAWLRLPESIWWARLEQYWHLGEPTKCHMCYFRPVDRGADHKVKHEAWARELAALEKMWTLTHGRTR